jgi:hypothetical protein
LVDVLDPTSGGISGISLVQALEKLGFAAELKSKIRLVSSAAATISTTSPTPGEVRPARCQPICKARTWCTSGSPAASEQPLPAKALIDFLAPPSAAPVYKTKWNGAGTTDHNERVRAEEFEPRSAGSTQLFRASGVRLLAS